MKVAVLAHSFPRFPGDTHGPFVKDLCQSLAALGHEMHVLVPFDPELAGDPSSPLQMHSFRYIRPDRWHMLGYSRTLKRDTALKAWAWMQSPLYFFFGEIALRRLVRREGIELIHAHWLLPNGYIAARVHRATGVPVAITLHGSDIFMAERNGLFRSMARQTLSASSHVTSCSGDLQERLVRIGDPGDADKVLLVPNGTELEPAGSTPGEGLAARLSERLDLGGDRPLVVAVGRMVDKKGFRYLIEAIPEILAAQPRARFILGGGGELLEPLRARAQELGVSDSVRFPGMLSHHEVLELIAAADVFVMPSIRDRQGNIDGLPIVVLEAMAAARPIVATAIAGIPLAVEDGRTGVLVPEKDSAALSAGITALLADPERCQRLGEAARERVRDDLNWDAVARRHDQLYRLAAESASGTGSELSARSSAAR